MTQLDLCLDDDASALCRSTDPDTSFQAGANVNLKRGRKLALEALLKSEDGLTDFELADITGFQQTSIGKRRTELRDMGLVVDSGNRRRTPSGATAIVWRAL